MTNDRRADGGAALSAMEVMIPLSCRSTTFSRRTRSGPQNKVSAVTSMDMTRDRVFLLFASVRGVDQFALGARWQEFAREHFRRRRRAGELIAFDDDPDGARHAVVLDVADADVLHFRRHDQFFEGI